MDAFYEAAKQLSPPVAAALAALEPGVASGGTEIRLRCQQPVTLQTMQGTLYLTKSGHVRMCPASDSLRHLPKYRIAFMPYAVILCTVFSMR